MIYRVVIKSSHRPSVFRAPSLLDYKLVSEIACSSVDLGLSMLFAASLIVVLERKIVQRRAVGTYWARGTITPPPDFVRNRSKTLSFKNNWLYNLPLTPRFSNIPAVPQLSAGSYGSKAKTI